MANIKVKELREVLKQNQKDNIKVAEYNGLQIEIKQFLTITEKLTLIKSIFESAIDRENGLHILNGNNLDIAFKVLLVQTYSNLTLPKNIIGSYNLLCESGLYNFIYDNIPQNEILDLQMALNNHIDAERDEYEQKNTIQYIIKDLLGGLIDKIPDEEGIAKMIDEAKKTMDGFSPDKMKFVQEFLAKTSGENID